MSCSMNCPSKPDSDPDSTPPIPPSRRLTVPRCCNNSDLCCRPKWRKTDCACRVQYIINYRFPVLPSMSCRYKKWISQVEPRTDSNFCASRFSSRRENQALIASLPRDGRDVCQDPCPCHCCA